MVNQSELNSRAELCRKLAQREPANRTFWMAEAENWSRLSREKPRAENSKKIDSGNSGGFARAIGKIPGLILTQQTLHEKRSREMYVGQPVK